MTQQIKWEVGVFPYKAVNGETVSWNSVVRRLDPGASHWKITVFPPESSPKKAETVAVQWLRKYGVTL